MAAGGMSTWVLGDGGYLGAEQLTGIAMVLKVRASFSVIGGKLSSYVRQLGC